MCADPNLITLPLMPHTADSNGYAGGYFQAVDGLVEGTTATVQFALWSDGGSPNNICFSAYLGTIQLIVVRFRLVRGIHDDGSMLTLDKLSCLFSSRTHEQDPCLFKNEQWYVLRQMLICLLDIKERIP